jgi:MFS family permease
VASVDVGQAEVAPAKSSAAYPTALQGWWTVGVLTALYAVSMMDRQVFNLLVVPIGQSLAINDFELALLSGFAFAAFYALFGVVFGWTADRYPRRGIILGGVWIWSAATAACGLARNFGQFALARFFVGGGEAALNPAAYSIIADTIPRARLSMGVAIFTTGVMIGGLTSKLIAATLMAVIPEGGIVVPFLGHQESWRVVFLAVGLPGLLLGLAVLTFPEPVRRQRLGEGATGGFGAAARFMLKRWRFYAWFFTGAALISAANYAFGAWTPAFFMRTFGLTVSQTGFLMAPMLLVPQIAGLIIAGAIADKLFAKGRKDIHITLVMVLGAAKAVIVAFAMTTELNLMTTAVLLSFATLFSGVVGVSPALLQLVTPNEFRGQVSATYLFITTLVGMGLGPLIAGALTTFVFEDPAKVGWAIAASFVVLIPFSILAFWAAMRGARQAAAESEAWAGA